MKKTVFILAAMMAVAMSANAQWFDFRNNVHRYEIGINLGVAGLGTQFHDFGFGANLSAWGVYLDIVTAGPMYKYDNHVNVGIAAMVPDSTATSISLGYQIPVLPWLRIMPIIGHTHVTSGYTDFSTVNVEVNENSGQMYHDYVKQGPARHYWHFGGGLVISPVKWVSIYGVYTTHAAYGGLSFNLGALMDED
ncbi:MAG: hypothetical protein IKP83_03740 [Bacteroidales bacterium]|nr:hypothetical protein [Bacteroidales bacterium]